MDYDQKCELVRKENNVYLDLFEDDLVAAKLTKQTIKRHITNVNFYINIYLLRYDVNHIDQGAAEISAFLGDFFIRKCMWSTPATIKSTAASIKKFYKCMVNHGKVEKEVYDELCETIKEEMDDWLSDCEDYNSGGFNPFW